MSESIGLFVLNSRNEPVRADRDFYRDFMDRRLNVIAQSDMTIDGVRVVFSTVFTGTNANGALFETRIFGGAYNDSRWIYSDYESAKNGHHIVVRSFEQEYNLEAKPCVF